MENNKERVVLGVRFQRTGTLHYMDPLSYGFRVGDLVIANSKRGIEIGRVVSIKNEKEIDKNINIEKIIKPATKYDVEKQKTHEENAKIAVKKCKEIANELGLDMKVIHAEYTFDGTKLIFYFSADDRIDFRELVKRLAIEYKIRIELRQVGPRDEIKMYPNLGMCGKEVCCRTFLPDFESVTIKMAKEQGVQINMSKISGACGRLMCCLKYEQDTYKENLKDLPKQNEIVKYNGEDAKVIGLDILNKKVRLKIGIGEDEKFETADYTEIKRINNKNKDKDKETISESDANKEEGGE